MSPSGASPATAALDDAQLHELDGLVEEALASGDESRLRVLGYGEISLVLGWPHDEPRFACKRLPAFPSTARFEDYRRTLDAYLDALRAAQIEPVATELRGVPRDGGAVTGYAIQPVLPADELAPEILGRAAPADGHPLVEAIVDTAARTVTPRVGLDAQLSNWSWDGAVLTYLDVTTPMLWSDRGRLRLDVEVLVQPIPWPLRGAIRRFLAPRILDGYRDLRDVYLDLCGNLIKERLDRWLPWFLDAVGDRVSPPISERDVRGYYRSDARLWALLLALRRVDRGVHRRVLHRPYPFLLPKRIER